VFKKLHLISDCNKFFFTDILYVSIIKILSHPKCTISTVVHTEFPYKFVGESFENQCTTAKVMTKRIKPVVILLR